MRVMVTGGAGFVGSALVRYLLSETNDDVINVDLFPGGDLVVEGLHRGGMNTRYFPEKANIGVKSEVTRILEKYRPQIVFHLASFNDPYASSIDPKKCLQINVSGTFEVLEACRVYLQKDAVKSFRFVYASGTDVYGSPESSMSEKLPTRPETPLAASRVSAESLVLSWWSSFGVPGIVTRASTNYGPYQPIESGIIPTTVECGLDSVPIQLYTSTCGIVRDWVHVDDHCRGLHRAALLGKPGQVYNLGGGESWTNEQIIRMICGILDQMVPRRQGHHSLVEYKEDQPYRDTRLYVVDSKKAYNELMWVPQVPFMLGLRHMVEWCIEKKFAACGIRRRA